MTTCMCPACNGRRKEINHCGMRVDCTACDGKGVIDTAKDEPIEAIKQIPEPLRRKPGRKPKPKVIA